MCRTFTELVAWAGIQFQDFGLHDLDGVARGWRLTADY